MRQLFLVIAILLCTVAAHAQNVFKTPSGKKYHLASCRMVKNVSQEITTAKAKEAGLEPCKICNPANIYANGIIAPHKASGEAAATSQCKGLTKKGTRCKHMTSIANGYCFQHQP